MPSGEVPKSIKASLYIDGKPAENSIKNLNQVTANLRKELNGLTIGTDAFNKKAAELQNVKGYLTKIKEEAAGVGDAFTKVREEIAHIAEGVAIGTIISQGIRGALESVKAFLEGSEKAYEEATIVQTSLINKLTQTGSVAGQTKEQLDNYQKTLQAQTGIDDDVIAKGEDVVLSYTNIRGYIYQQSIPAITNLAAAQNMGKVTMESMSSAAELLAKALDKPTAAKKVLRQIGIDLTSQQEKEIKTLNDTNQLQKAQQIILDEVNKRYGNLAQTLANTDVGVMQRFNTRLGNIQESLGGMILKTKSAAAEALEPFLTLIEKITEVPLAEKVKDEQTELNSLVGAIVSCNDNQKVRNQLITELQAKYPEFIGNIKAETVTNKLLTDQLAAANDQYRLKIFMAANEDKLKKIQEDRTKAIRDEAAARERVATATGLSATALAKLSDEQFKNLAIKNQADLLTSLNHPGSSAAGNVPLSADNGQIISDVKLILNGKKAIEAADKEESDLLGANSVYQQKLTKLQVDNIDKQIAALKEKIKTEKDEAKASDEAQLERLKNQRNTLLGIVTPPTSGPTEQELEAARKRDEELKKKREEFLLQAKALFEKIKEFNGAELADTLSKNEKEVADTKLKYDRIEAETQAFIDKNKNNPQADPEKLQQAQAAIGELQINKDKEVNDVIIRQHKELTDSIKLFQEEGTATAGTELDKQTVKINAFYDNWQKKVGNNDPLATVQIYVGRIISLSNAELAEKKKLIQEKEKLDDEYDTLTDNKNTSNIAKINKKYDQELADLKKSYNDKLKTTKEYQAAVDAIERNRQAAIKVTKEELARTEKEAAIQAAQDVSNAEFTIAANSRHAETDARIQSLEDQRSATLKNTNLTEEQQAAINDKYNKEEADIKLEAWKADQTAAEEQAIINAALAITKVFATIPPPLSFIEAGAVAVETGAQIAVIASEKPPQFGDGSYTDSDPSGYVGQPTLFRNSASGRPFVAGEAGKEWIAPNWMVKNPRYANIIGMLEVARQEKRTYAGGGFNNNAGSGAGQAYQANDNSELVAEMRATREAIQNQQVFISYDYWKKEMAKMAQIENNSNAGKKS